MGNCCASSGPEAEVNIARSTNRNKDYKPSHNILDDREVNGLTGSDKIILIIKIQSLARGNIARKKV